MKNLEMMKQIMRESGIKSKESMLAEINQEIELRQKDIEDGQWYFFDNMLLDEIIDIKIQLIDDMKRVEGDDLFFAKVRPTAKIPTKDDENMGYDIYADFEEDYTVIQPHETKMIPTGICSACSEDYAIVLKERGSTGTKGIAQRCGVIDSGYRGEWFVPITNTTNNPIAIIKKENEDLIDDLSLDHIIYPYEKAICQAVVLPVPKMNVKEISLEELKSIPSKRGEGSRGSSGK
jgi:dUTP pyrophosphatase